MDTEMPKFLEELENCKLCEWQCGVDRLSGELGVCKMGVPQVASCQLHPAPPQSYTIFTAGCNFKCLNCQNCFIAHYPDIETPIRGYVDPKELAIESIAAIKSSIGKLIGADRIFFSGGEPTIHLPYIEKIVEEARKIDPETKVNFDTNGFLTMDSLRRVLRFTTSITFDIKAYNDDVHRALTGAPSEPVLSNAEYIARYARDKLWEYRILVIPGIIDVDEIKAICEFIASIDPSLPICFLAFRPNFVLDQHMGATWKLMNKAVEIARKVGLTNVNWAGGTNIPGYELKDYDKLKTKISGYYKHEWALKAAVYAFKVGCRTHPRNCGSCNIKLSCPVKKYVPERVT
ncbi:MAG: radical SAM protein [Candidatus Asgardarchaeia archaeon]